jgi:putative Ca2+/H+ antiporter (TMEM165/GDT1 family)
MDALLVSTLAVAIAELGDKTQLLALVLAARFRRPVPIAAGILVATLANHALAGLLGAWLGHLLNAAMLRWLLAGSFLLMGGWMLIPDRPAVDETKPSRFGPFLVTLVLFFLVEIGDKTQIATIALGARFASTLAVVLGTTAGMMLANLPVVWIGPKLMQLLPLKLARLGAAGLFTVLGIATLLA